MGPIFKNKITEKLYKNKTFRKAIEEVYSDSSDSYVRRFVGSEKNRILMHPNSVFENLDKLFIRLDDSINSVIHYGSSIEVGKEFHDVDLAVITEKHLSDEEKEKITDLLKPQDSALCVSVDEYGWGITDPVLVEFGLHLWLLSKDKVPQMIREYFLHKAPYFYRDIASGILKGNVIYHKDDFIFDTKKLIKRLNEFVEKELSELELKHGLKILQAEHQAERK
jgi:hypothetical protein